RLADAQALYEKVRLLADETPLPASERQRYRIRGWAGVAAVAEVRRQWQTARDALQQWLELEPKAGSARQRLARAIFHLGQTEEALAELRRAVELDPALEPAEVSFAKLHAETSDTPQASLWFAQAARQLLDDPRAQLAQASWLLQQEQPEEARPFAEAAVRLDPQALQPQLILALIARQLQDFAQAEHRLQTIIERTPADFAATNQLALVLIERSGEPQRQRALQLAEINARQYPQHPEARATLGWIELRLGRLAEARADLQVAVSGGEASADTAYYLARLHAQSGDRDEARRLVRDTLAAPLGRFFNRQHAQRWWDDDLGKEVESNSSE
ncbi:MAG: tetratricopeptide repeat protein, partial [Planctomycetales bacterium]